MSEVIKKKLLIVDSDFDLKDQMYEILKESYDLNIIDNATEAINYSETDLPDIILIDLDMPQIDGFELLYHLDEHPTLCDVPVITMIDDRDEKYSKRAYEEGSSGMIYKPFNPNNLIRDIEGLLKHTSNQITSSNNRVNYLIEFSDKNKQKKLREIISEQDYENEPLIVLSWNRGEDLLDYIENIEDKINSNRLVFLEMKPSLISKFPYLQDITPVVSEIKNFLTESSIKYHLVMEEPSNLLNIDQKERSISQAYNIAQLLHGDFNRITYINTRPQQSESIKFTSKVGNILTGLKN